MTDLSDLELLRIEVETIWQRDERGRLSLDPRSGQATEPLLVIACGRGSRIVCVGAAVPDALAGRLAEAAERGEVPDDSSRPPEALDACDRLLTTEFGGVVRSSGPGYFVPPGTQFAPTARIVSRPGEAAMYSTAPTGAGWTPDEWESLVGGDLGPFALAVLEGRVVSICHCSRFRQSSAEAGVWTHPDCRGMGLAASVTAAWARLVQETGRIAFYSTSSENRSSQRVAARLRLRNIGTVWTLSAKA